MAIRASSTGDDGATHPKTPLGSAGGQGPPQVPMPYLGQQPEGEKEHGFHGPAAGRLAECPAGRGRAVPPASTEPG